jgi:replication factor C subunit 2/4
MSTRPWIEKYRPIKMKDVVEQGEIIKILKNTIKTGNLPNIIFYGPAGCGKTSTILSFVRELYKKNVNERIIELNASDERGIKIVREKILTFVKSSISDDFPPFKFVILDEADAMTTEAQSALRKIMEDRSEKTRFCFICNYINQIIEPIASRCMKFRFKPISVKAICERLKYIAKLEKLKVSDEVVKVIGKTSRGDARQAILMLQNIKYLMEQYKIKMIEVDNLYSIFNIINENEIDVLWNVIRIGDIKQILKVVQEMNNKGYSTRVIIEELIKRIIKMKELNDKQKCEISIECARLERMLNEGCSEELILLRFTTFIKAVKIKN